MLRKLLSHPLTRNAPLDDPQTTILRRRIIQEKAFLRKIYEDWYRRIALELPQQDGPVLEIGSGAGFLSEYVPRLITSDIVPISTIDVRLSALNLPFQKEAFRAIVMVDAMHHLPKIEDFFHGAVRCLNPGGCMVVIEPWVSWWSRKVYGKLHHEPFEPGASEWSFASAGPLTSANGALPWILFERDRQIFEKKFPELRIQSIEPLMPISYLLSGGVSLRSLMPGFTYRFWRMLENRLPLRHWAMFAKIKLVRSSTIQKLPRPAGP
jgi:SAM-dependent methyltransferase